MTSDQSEAPVTKSVPVEHDPPGQSGRTGDRERLRAVERLAVLLSDSGMPRMAARLFAFALASDDDAHTASGFADALEVSPAAVSGAVRYLAMVSLLIRDREPGVRADVYRIADGDVWTAIAMARMPILTALEAAAGVAADLVPAGTRGHGRLRETEEYFRFSVGELRALTERWQRHRTTLASNG
ncbi:MAG: hypothetical protein ACRDPI_06070 [Nocardioidaceae bacterium]